jgi:DNA-binding beta-propeller fold protein YncE
LVAFARDSVSGRLTLLTALVNGFNGVDGLDGANDVAVSPDATNVYVTASDSDVVTAFARESGASALRFLGVYEDGAASPLLGTARAVAVSLDGGVCLRGGLH